MKSISFAAALAGIAFGLVGCDPGSPDGPGASSSPEKQNDDTSDSQTLPQVGPKWQIENAVLKDYDGDEFSTDVGGVTFQLIPNEGNRLAVLDFTLTALRSDDRAMELLSKKRLVRVDKLKEKISGDEFLFFDMNRLNLVDSEGNQFPAKWNLDGSVQAEFLRRDGIYSIFGASGPDHWEEARSVCYDLDDEFRAFLIEKKKISTDAPLKGTDFSGLLSIDHPVQVSFIFILPKSLGPEDLSLQFEDLASVPLAKVESPAKP